MPKSDRLQLLFAHTSETIPIEFHNYAKPPQQNPSPRQIQKWHSRRLAYYLLHILFKQNGIDCSLLQNIQRTDNGRPFVLHPHIDFNISHSGEWVAVLFRYNQQKKVVGLDIEHPQKIRRYQALLAHYAPQSEIAALHNLDIQPQLKRFEQRFYLSWCLREAILKSQGAGIIGLSEVRHYVAQQHIVSRYCPQGKLFFYHQLPFYLAYFSEQGKEAQLSEWKQGQAHIVSINPIIYHVNKEEE